MQLLPLRFVALDSSHWAKWIDASLSSDAARRAQASSFSNELIDLGFLPLFCWHHFEELLAIEDDVLADERLSFLADLPRLAWIGCLDEPPGLGAITDVLAAEALAAFDGCGGPIEIRKRTKARLIKIGKGRDVVGDEPWIWHAIRPKLAGRSDKAREITAITPIEFIKPTTTVGDLMAGTIRSEEEVSARFGATWADLSEEISKHGDERIGDPKGMAAGFLMEVKRMVAGLPRSPEDFVVQALLAQGLEREEISPERSLAELNDLAIFRSQLRVVASKTGYPFEALRHRVRMEQCPHWLIKKMLRTHGQTLPRRKGSDLNDAHLATLAAYSDVLYVDKRTAEDFRRATNKVPSLNDLIGTVRKASDYHHILAQLRAERGRALAPETAAAPWAFGPIPS